MTTPGQDIMDAIAEVEAARVLLGQIADKWTIEIMSKLCREPLRFNALKRSVSGITQKALAQALRRLERNGLVERRILPSSPPAVEYRITELGFSLEAPVKAMLNWTLSNLDNVEAARSRYDGEQDKG